MRFKARVSAVVIVLIGFAIAGIDATHCPAYTLSKNMAS
jgi:hypothetical protein